MKLAVVVQRYGQAINGGAELHARYIAEHLARHAQVEVLTTCATDYVTWRNELEPGVEQVNGVSVRRFKVKHERDPKVFGKRSDHVFEQPHSLGDELDWLDAEGPTSPALVDYIAKHAAHVSRKEQLYGVVESHISPYLQQVRRSATIRSVIINFLQIIMKNKPDFDHPDVLVRDIVLGFPPKKALTYRAMTQRFHERYGKIGRAHV